MSECIGKRVLWPKHFQEKKVPDYLEATIYNKEEAIIMVGNFADVDTFEKWVKVSFNVIINVFVTELEW